MARNCKMHLKWLPVTDNANLRIAHDVFDGLVVQIVYTLGGPDLWRGGTDPRGYYLLVTPIRNMFHDGPVRTSPVDGAKLLLKPVSRRSVKDDDWAKKAAGYAIPDVVSKVCAHLGARYDVNALKGV